MLTYFSTLRAIRWTRRVYGHLNWEHVGRIEQRKALAACVPSFDAVDLDRLARLGFWNEGDCDDLHVLISNASARRQRRLLKCHLVSRRLPDHAIMKVDEGVYSASPAYAALQYSYHHELADVFMLLMELLGSYCLAEELTFGIVQDEGQTSSGNKSDAASACYHVEPAVTLRELQEMAKSIKSSACRTFKTAVSLAAADSASPMESVMFGMLGAPMRYGGFGCSGLPKGGMLLNHLIRFDERSRAMASGMPYAIMDAYVPAAKTDIEYNGAGHECENARLHDGQRNNGIRGMGIKVVVINRDQMKQVAALEAIARSLYRDAGVRFRCGTSGYRVKQIAWLNDLRKAIGLNPI